VKMWRKKSAVLSVKMSENRACDVSCIHHMLNYTHTLIRTRKTNMENMKGPGVIYVLD
jgi:hypothetical protein